MIVFIGSSALSTVRLDSTQWGISLLLGALSLPIAMLIRLIPDDFIRKLCPSALSKPQAPLHRASRDDGLEWNDTIKDIRNELTFYKHIYGGRFNALKHTLQRARSPRYSLARSRSHSVLGPASVMAGIVAGSIAGWSPIEREDADDESTRLLR
jgi:Ca2+-transporting ATPase